MPQKPYLPLGNLATLLSYPQKSSISDDEMEALLAQVDLVHLMPLRHNTSWEQLSLGEQQRLAIARLFYQRPMYAILDECTSACTVWIEELLYLKLKELNIAFVTICHRPALKKFHDTNLHLTGSDGSFLVTKIDHSEDDESAPLRPATASRDEKSLRPSLVGSKSDQFAALRSENYKVREHINPGRLRRLLF